MSNHDHYDNPRLSDKSSLKAENKGWGMSAVPVFLRRWGWLAGILGFFLLMVAALWNVTISRAAFYHQPNGAENPKAPAVASEASSRQADAQVSELLVQLQELIITLKENDKSAAAGSMNLTADGSNSHERGVDPVAVQPEPEHPKITTERFLDGYLTTQQQANTQQRTEQQQKTTDPNATEEAQDFPGMTQEEKALFDLFDQYATAMEKDPESAETQELSKLLDAAMAKLSERMESDPNVSPGILDASKTEEQQETNAPPVETKQATGETKPPVTQQQQVKTAEPPVKTTTAAQIAREQAAAKVVDLNRDRQTEKLIPPPVEQKQAGEQAVPPVEQKQVVGQKETLPKQQQQQAANKVAAAGQTVAGQNVAAGITKPLVTETVIRPTTSGVTPEKYREETDPDISAGAEVKPTSDRSLQADPNDIVEITVEEFQLDIEMLIELIGKEFQFNFIYSEPTGVTGTVRFQQYGKVRRRDLIPMLESMLTFKGYAMVREGSVINVVKRADVGTQVDPLIAVGTVMPEVTPGDSIVTQIIEFKNTNMATAVAVLNRFVSTPQSIVPITNTNFIIITEFTKRMPRVLEMVKLIDSPGPPRRLVSMPVKYISAEQASSVIQIFIKELTSSNVSTSPAGAGRIQTQVRDPRTGRPTAVPQSQTGVAPAAADTFFYVDSRTDRLFIIGTDEQIEQVEYLLGLIDTEQLGAQVQLVSLEVLHIQAGEAITQIDQLLKSINELRSAGATSGSSTSPPQQQLTPAQAAALARQQQQLQAQRAATQGGGAAGLTKVSATGPFMHEHKRLNSIFVVGVEEQIEQIEELLALIDVPAGPPIKLVSLPVKHVSISEVQSQIEQLIKALNSDESSGSAGTQARPDPTAPPRQPNRPPVAGNPQTSTAAPDVSQGAFILPDESNLRLLVVGSEEQIEQIEELLELLDVSEGPVIDLVSIPIRNVDVTDIEGQIQTLLEALNESGGTVGAGAPGGERPGVNPNIRPPAGGANRALPQQASQAGTSGAKGPVIVTDERNRRLLVVGSEDQIIQVRELVALLDVVEGPEIELAPIRINNVPVTDIVGQIRDLLKALNDTGAGTSTTGGGEPSPAVGARNIPNRPPPTGQQASQQGTASSAEGPVIVSDERNMRILVVGSADQIEQVRELVALLDVIEGPEIKVHVLRVQHVPIPEFVDQMDKLLRALNESGGSTTSSEQPGSVFQSNLTRNTTGAAGQGAGMQSGQMGGQSDSQGPYILPDERNARIIVVCSDAQLQQVEELRKLLDVVEGPEIKLEPLYVRNVPIADIVGQVDDLLRALNETPGSSQATAGGMPGAAGGQRGLPTGRPAGAPGTVGAGMQGLQTQMSTPTGPYILPDERNLRLLVVGSEDQINQVRELLVLLDVTEGPEIKLESIPVQHLPLTDLHQQLMDILDVINENMSSSSSTMASGGRGMPQMGVPMAGGAPQRTAGELGSVTSSYGQYKPLGAYIMPDERNRRLLVVGSEEQIQQVRELMTMLDVIEGPEILLHTVRIQHVWADEVAGQLSDLIQALNDREQSSYGGQGFGFSSNLNFPSGNNRGMGVNNRTPQESGFEFSTANPQQQRRRQPRAGQGGGRMGTNGAFIFVDPKTNRLLIVGSQEQIDQILDLLNVLDVPPDSREKLILRVFHPQYVEVSEVEAILNQLGLTQTEDASYREQTQSSGFSDTLGGTGQLIQTSTPVDTGFTQSFEGQAIPSGPQEPEIRIAIQEVTNRLFVLATEYQLLDIEEIIRNVDVELVDSLGAIQVYPLDNQEPADVKAMLEELLESTREIQGVEQVVSVPGKIGAPIVVALEQSHAIAVNASQKDHEMIANLIGILDKRPAQVLVEAILVQVSASESLKLGIGLQQHWDVGGLRAGSRIVSGLSPFGFAPSLGSSGIVAGEGATLAFFDDDLVFATLEALQDETDTKIVSKPRILVNDNETGTITSQREEPTTRTTIPAGSDTPIIEFQGYESAGTTLTITPHISESDFLQLEIGLSVNSFEGEGSANVPPPKSTNDVTTKVTVPDGMTIILGGLTTQNDGTTENKVPLLGDIPILGALFRNVTRSELEGVLYVFVRAEIVRKPDFSDLDNISENFRNKLRTSELDYQNQSSLIPGLPDVKRERPSALDEFNQKIRTLNINEKDKNPTEEKLNGNGTNLSYNWQFGKDK